MSAETVAGILSEAESRMGKAVAHARSEFSSVRTGRASPALVEKLTAHAYGQDLPIQQLAGFQVPEARLLMITPYDRANLGPIEKAIQHSDLGLNPSNDGVTIRLAFPPLTQERRKELVKRVKGMAEDGRLAVRSARREARKNLESLAKSGAISDDDVTRAEKELDRLTHAHEAGIDKSLADKEQELLEV